MYLLNEYNVKRGTIQLLLQGSQGCEQQNLTLIRRRYTRLLQEKHNAFAVKCFATFMKPSKVAEAL